MNAVEINRLTKTYDGGKTAVDSLSIRLAPGEVFGFLGPNGAGKTTTVKLLNGMLSPTQGSLRIFGIDPSVEPEKVHAISGIVTEHAQMYDMLTGMENLAFFGTVFGFSRKESRQRGEALLGQLELSDAGDQKLATYSTGMRQRLSLARALIHHPRILFLDEPTSGLDPDSAKNVHSMIRRLAEENGITIFLCTHQLRYAQEICTRYGLMAQGQLLAEGTLEELCAGTGKKLAVRLRTSGLPADLLHHRTGEREYEIPIQDESEIPELVRRIAAEGWDIYHVSAIQPSLEDIYFSLTQNTRRNHDK